VLAELVAARMSTVPGRRVQRAGTPSGRPRPDGAGGRLKTPRKPFPAGTASAAATEVICNPDAPVPVKEPTPMLAVSIIERPLGVGTGAAADEAALLDSLRRSAPGSREALYHRYKRRVFALAVRIVGPMDAEEVTQEAFIRIFRGLGKFRGDSALGTWIYRLAVNAALSHRSRRRPDAPEAHSETEADTLVAEPPAHGQDGILRARLQKALERLPVGYRTVIVLHDVEGLEHEEVASILGCHVGTSKSQLHKARAKLRELLSQDGITATALERG